MSESEWRRSEGVDDLCSPNPCEYSARCERRWESLSGSTKDSRRMREGNGGDPAESGVEVSLDILSSDAATGAEGRNAVGGSVKTMVSRSIF